MSQIEERVRKWLKVAATAPYDETKEYEKFNNVFIFVEAAGMIAASYLCFLALGESLKWATDWLANNISILKPRIQFLTDYDRYSLLSYSATILTCSILMPIMLVIRAVGYWKTVVAKQLCKGINSRALISLLLLVTVSGVIAGVAFVDVPQSYDPRWPGNARWFFWPLHPLLGAGAAFFVNITLFSIFVGGMKFAFLRGGRYG